MFPATLFETFVTEQLSLETGVPRFTFVAVQPELADTITSGGQKMVGAWVSLTVTENVQVLVLPEASVAVLVTRVRPIGKVDPDKRLETRLVTEQLSVAVTEKMTLLRLHWPASAVRTRLDGQVRTGFCVSVTVTENVQELVLPEASVAVLVTVVTPIGKVDPDKRLETRLVTEQLSVAVTEKVTLLRLH